MNADQMEVKTKIVLTAQAEIGKINAREKKRLRSDDSLLWAYLTDLVRIADEDEEIGGTSAVVLAMTQSNYNDVVKMGKKLQGILFELIT